jgi:riboflavin kinase/FMN adenylyltransferase
VLTLDTHPLLVLSPGKAPPLLTANRHKLALLAGAGIEGCLLMPFTGETAALEPEDFIARLCDSVPHLKAICVGKNWQFGRSGRGNAGLLETLASNRGVAVTVAEPVLHGGKIISSTRIRAAVSAGDLAGASEMLGRPFSVLGTVARGRSVGRTLGFPTANLDIHNEVRPPAGVYAVHARIDDVLRDGVINVGVRPTFHDGNNAAESLEIHLPGIDMDLYGKDIEVLFIARIREERRFDSTDHLKQQIARDVEAAVAFFPEKASDNGS